jgi:hypothetical protein
MPQSTQPQATGKSSDLWQGVFHYGKSRTEELPSQEMAALVWRQPSWLTCKGNGISLVPQGAECRCCPTHDRSGNARHTTEYAEMTVLPPAVPLKSRRRSPLLRQRLPEDTTIRHCNGDSLDGSSDTRDVRDTSHGDHDDDTAPARSVTTQPASG